MLEFYSFSKWDDRRASIRFRNISATSAIKRPFAVQIITDASSLFFCDRRISDCALISVLRLIRDDAFSGISERFITKKVSPRPMDGRCHARCFFHPRVLSCVVTYSSEPQFRSANGFLARTAKIRHEFAAR